MRFGIAQSLTWAAIAAAAIAPLSMAQAPAAQSQTALASEMQPELKPSAGCEEEPDRACRLGDSLILAFTNLAEWSKADSAKHDPKSLVLYLNGRPVKGLPFRMTGPNEVRYDLKRIDADSPDGTSNREAWTALLSGSHNDRRMEAAVGLGDIPYDTKASFTFRVFPTWAWLVYLFLIGISIVFVLLAYHSDIIRDPGPDPGVNRRRSYSLARCQMAWWFFLVLAAFNYIWMVTGGRDSLTPGVLTLIGISAATGFSAAMVDSGKRDRRLKLQTEIGSLTTLIPELQLQLAAAPPPAKAAEIQAQLQQKTARLAEAQASLASLPSAPGPSQGFRSDILSDEDGISFHRFQIAVWTIVLGFVLVISVYNALAMPDFSATMLGLMGISAGTYVGFKIPDSPK